MKIIPINLIKILELNMWNYNDFDERKAKIIRLIKKQNPDIVALNEVADDIKLNKNGENQLKQLNKELNYPYQAFYPVEDMHEYNPEKYKHYMVLDGNAVLSKYPILKVIKKKLKKQKGDKHHRGILHVKIKTDKVFDIIVVHFSNHDVFSLLHLNETLDYARKKLISPIIIGDFNILKPEQITKLTKTSYKSSYTYKNYITYPSKKETLDYILIPKTLKFKSLKCLKDKVSDHRALLASIA